MTEQNKDHLSAQRRGHKAYATTLMNEANGLITNASEDKAVRMKTISTLLSERMDIIEGLDNQIISVITNGDAIEAEIVSSSEHKMKMQEVVIGLTDAWQNVFERNDNLSVRNSGSNKPKNAKLPKLVLKPFSGDILMFQEFWESFKSAVDDDDDLDKVTKFNYLRSLLKSQAYSTISGLSLTAENYDEAVCLLKSRYGNKQVLISAHIDKLLSLPVVNSPNDVTKLREIYDCIEINVRGLKGLEITISHYGPILVSIVMSKLPTDIRLLISRAMSSLSLATTSGEWKIDELLKYLKQEIESRELCGFVANSENERRQKRNHAENFTASSLFTGTSEKDLSCTYCGKGHSSAKCDTVTDVSSRKAILRRKGRCFLCLKPHHVVRFCQANYKCGKCRGKHHISICEPNFRRTENAETPKQDKDVDPVTTPKHVSSNVVSNSKSSTLLQTAKAMVSGLESESTKTVRVLFDGASQKSFVTEDVRKVLKLRSVRKERMIIKGFGSKEESMNLLDVVKIRVCDVSGSACRVIEAYVVPLICSPICGQNIELAKKQYEHLWNLTLADAHDGDEKLDVDILVGADYYWHFVTNKMVSGEFGPVALDTSLGWVLSGTMPASTCSATNIIQAHVMTTTRTTDDTLHDLVQRFWQLDSIGVCDDENIDLMENFKRDVEFDGNRYSVRLPWKQDTDLLPDNYVLCKRRFELLLKRLKGKPDLLQKYDEIIKGQLTEGIIERVQDKNCDVGNVHYIPHREIVREGKSTTKVRIVYDASARMKNCPSLNECLEKGPCMLPKLFNIIIRFRCFKYALISDIKAAFLNIRVNEKDRDFLRFLWIDDVHKDDPEMIVFRFTSVLFGASPSPFLLSATILVHMQKYAEKYPDIVGKFLRDLFMDDNVTGAQSMHEAFRLYSISKKLMKEGGFTLRKWTTNDPELRAEINEAEMRDSKESEKLETVGENKVLGVNWKVDVDELHFSVGMVVEEAMEYQGTITKRYVLKIIASIFDPMGILSPVTIGFKMLLQEIFQSKCVWDDEINNDLQLKWKKLLETASRVGRIQLPRHYLGGRNLSDVKAIEVHGFCDASAKAYAAVVYLRLIFADGSMSCVFVASKSRVAPMKTLTIPRLELMSCLILSRLVKVILESIVDFEIKRVICWSDSIDCLYWIGVLSKIRDRFVQNRITEIRSNLPSASWNHCPGAINPADIPSRGISIANIEKQKVWVQGPEFLRHDEQSWPDATKLGAYVDSNTSGICEESISVNTNINEVEITDVIVDLNAVIDTGDFHSFRKLITVTAYGKRFIENCKSLVKGDDLQLDRLSVEEKNAAQRLWLIYEQRTIDERRLKQLTVSLGAYLDNGVIKLKGRLENSDLPTMAKYPTFIPRESNVGNLIILDAHERVLHSGVKDTLCEVRAQFWLSRGRQRVRKVLGKCVLCKKFEAKPFTSLPASPLPDFRTQCCDPFTHVGVDYLGPLHVYPTPSGKSLEKIHVVLYTCANSRAVHLDIVPDASCFSFVNSLKRFVSRRGLPKLFISDNAKCFVGPELKNFLKKFNIDWQFILEVSPWWGGFWERLVQTVKRSLRKILRRTSVTYDELLTVLTEIEGTINCRPLCYMYSDNIEEVLTPSHLLTGRRLMSPRNASDVIHEENSQTMKKRLDYLSSLVSHYQKRWQHEYLTDLREYQRSNNKSPAKVAKVGDIVLIEDDLPRVRWRLGKIVELFTSKDGHVRGCKLRVSSSNKKVAYLNRPINKLCYFEVSCVPDGES